MKLEIGKERLSPKAAAVKVDVISTLNFFAEQNSEFKQAVEQNSHTFAELLEAAVKGAGSSISDITVYRKAVQFIFPGADVKFNMTIDLGDEGFSNDGAELPSNALKLDFDDLF